MPSARATNLSRAEQFRETAKRTIIGGVFVDATNTTATTEGVTGDTKNPAALVDGTNESHISMVIEDLEKGFEKKLDGIKTEMMECKNEQLQAHYSGMMKIPKSTREMTIQEFNDKYNSNLLDLLRMTRSASIGNTSPSVSTGVVARKVPAPMCGKRDRFETPAPYRANRPMQTPATVVRTVRRGEMML